MDTDDVAFAKALVDETRQEIMKHLCCAWLGATDVVDKVDAEGAVQRQPGMPRLFSARILGRKLA